MFCKKCGKNILKDSVFCEFCGKSLNNNTKNKIVDIQDNNKNFIVKIKKAGILFAVWIVSFGFISMLSDPYADEFDNFIVSIALSSLVVFVWKKVSGRYL